MTTLPNTKLSSPTLPWIPRPVTIALAQFGMTPSPQQNLERAIEFIEKASDRKADIVCLPELFRSPYFCTQQKADRDYSEAIPGEVVPALGEVARKFSINIIGGSIHERTDTGKLFNTTLVINRSGELAGTYRKVHIPHDEAFYEMNYFTPGDTGFKVFDLGIAKVGVLICYDQWFPEAARTLALMGAEIIFYPTAIGRVAEIESIEGDWQHAWQTVQCGHAVANNVVVAAVNRVGVEGTSTFWGGSFICNGFGQVLAHGTETSSLIIADVDLGHSQYSRETWRFFESRRPSQYHALTDERLVAGEK
jgi:predicted amidohydrolase